MWSTSHLGMNRDAAVRGDGPPASDPPILAAGPIPSLPERSPAQSISRCTAYQVHSRQVPFHEGWNPGKSQGAEKSNERDPGGAAFHFLGYTLRGYRSRRLRYERSPMDHVGTGATMTLCSSPAATGGIGERFSRGLLEGAWSARGQPWKV